MRLAVFAIGVMTAFAASAFDPFVVKDIRVEGIQRVEAGTVFSYLPVKVGDTIRVHLRNPATNLMPHSVDFHASMVAWNDEMTSINPGEEKVYEWSAEYAGVWMYHCGTAPALHHIANGMYGMVIVEPAEGLAPVDKEFAIVQSEWYFDGQGKPASLTKAAESAPAPERPAVNAAAVDVFAAYTWQPPPPPPVPAGPPPKPMPPPLPYVYAGRVVDGGKTQFLLLEQGTLHSLAAGAAVGDYLLESGSDTQLVFLHRPTGERQTLAIAPQASLP